MADVLAFLKSEEDKGNEEDQEYLNLDFARLLMFVAEDKPPAVVCPPPQGLVNLKPTDTSGMVLKPDNERLEVNSDALSDLKKVLYGSKDESIVKKKLDDSKEMDEESAASGKPLRTSRHLDRRVIQGNARPFPNDHLPSFYSLPEDNTALSSGSDEPPPLLLYF